MGALRFPGSPAVVNVASGMTGNVGTSLYSVRLKSGPSGITLPASGIAGFIGGASSSTSNGFAVNSSGQIRVYQGGTNRYGSTAGLIVSGVPFDYVLTHNADGTWDIFDNMTGLPTGESGTFSTSLAWASGTALNQFGRSSSSNSVYLQGDIEFIEVTGLANAQKWDANLSAGSGSTWPTTSGSNQGTLSGFDTAVCWVDFSTAIEFASNSRSTSLSESALTTAINFASMSYSTSASTSDIVAGAINFASMSYSTSLAFSEMATQISFLSSSRSTSSGSSDLVNDTPTFNSLANSTSASYSNLSTSILFNSVANSTSASYSNLTEEVMARYIERWDGLNFNSHPLERWDGSTFKKHPLMRWDGDQWIQYNG